MKEQWSQPNNDEENEWLRRTDSKEAYKKGTARKDIERAVETKLSGGRAERRKNGSNGVRNGALGTERKGSGGGEKSEGERKTKWR